MRVKAVLRPDAYSGRNHYTKNAEISCNMRVTPFLIALLCVITRYAHAVAEDALLGPQEAFKYSACVLDAHRIEARFQDWCVSCIACFTFAHPKVQEMLKAIVLLKADVTANTDEEKALLKRFSLFGPPRLSS